MKRRVDTLILILSCAFSKTNRSKNIDTAINKRLVEETDRSLCGFTEVGEGTNVLSSNLHKLVFVVLDCTCALPTMSVNEISPCLGLESYQLPGNRSYYFPFISFFGPQWT